MTSQSGAMVYTCLIPSPFTSFPQCISHILLLLNIRFGEVNIIDKTYPTK